MMKQVVIFLLTFALNINRLELNAIYTEQELLTLLKAKNEKAFSYLYKNFSGALYSTILQIIPDQEQANSILKETFIYIGFKINEYDAGKGKLFTWMLNNARNLSIDALRTQETLPLAYKEKIRVVWQDNTNNTGLRKALSQLQPEQAGLLEMVYFKGYTAEKIALDRDLPTSTVKKEIRHALIQLSRYIK